MTIEKQEKQPEIRIEILSQNNTVTVNGTGKTSLDNMTTLLDAVGIMVGVIAQEKGLSFEQIMENVSVYLDIKKMKDVQEVIIQ